MLKLSNLSLELGDFKLTNLNFEVKQGEYFMLLGESGAGKSVLLECISGLIKAKSGDIFLNNINITQLPIQKRKIGLVFQDFALFPHLTVAENIAFPLKLKKTAKKEIENITMRLASEMNIECLLHRNTNTLSGGEKQRVALARTLTLEPDILLLDEPLASIDVSLKADLRSLLRRINQQGKTIIHVTHDYEEAISLAQRLAIIHNGEIMQIGTPNEVFTNPKNKFVAHFGGVKNFYPATLEQDAEKETAKACITNQIAFQILTKYTGTKGYVLIGQKNILISKKAYQNETPNQFNGVIQEIIPARFGFELVVDAGISFYISVTAEMYANNEYTVGQSVFVAFNPSSVKFIPG